MNAQSQVATRIYLINLARDAGRLAAMREQLDKLGLSFDRIEAVHGIFMPTWLHPYFLNNRGQIASGLSAGEVGCYASHLEAMRRIVASGKPGIVLEDDVAIAEDFGQIIEAVGDLPKGWDIVRLSNDFFRGFVPVNPLAGRYQAVKFRRVPTSSGAYLITPEAATKFLAWKTLRTIPIDHDLRQPWNCKLVTYGVYPQSVTHTEGESAIGAGRWTRYRGWKDLTGLRNNILRTVYTVQWLGVRESLKFMAGSR